MRPDEREPGRLGLWLIGATKLASGVMLAAAGFGIFRLLHADLGAAAEHWALRLHLDPENRLVHDAVARVGGLDRRHLEAIGAGTFFYAALHLVEGTGLVLRRRWAEYLTVVITGSLLPLEFFEVARKVNVLRLGVLAVNLAIVVYLVARLWRGRRGHKAGAQPAIPSSASQRS